MSDPKAVVPGVGPEAPTVVNEAGGRQSACEYRMGLHPPRALLAVARVLDRGARKYGVGNWKKIDARDHLNHALVHAFAWLAGDGQEEHLEHFACRALMALEMALAGAKEPSTGRETRLPERGT